MNEKSKAEREKEQLELGKKLQMFYESGYVNKRQALGWSLLKGTAQGFGVVIGGTFIVALLLWILSAFDSIPFIGPWVDSIRDSLGKSV